MKRFATVIALVLSSLPAWSTPVLLTDDAGDLYAALGVDVNGAQYNVSFMDGTCIEVFDGCDQPGDLDFTDHNDAFAASLALLTQVFLNTQEGLFDSNPYTTAGCSNFTQCRVFTPWRLDSNQLNSVFVSRADNWYSQYYDRTSWQQAMASTDMRQYGEIVWANWERVAAASEPGTLVLFTLGLIAVARRRST